MGDHGFVSNMGKYLGMLIDLVNGSKNLPTFKLRHHFDYTSTANFDICIGAPGLYPGTDEPERYKIRRLNPYTKYFIKCDKDEWFYVYVSVEEDDPRSSKFKIPFEIHYYKCDQFDGLIYFLKERNVL
jgi:hypothetical protein